MQFELTRTTAKFGVFNPREEKNKGNAFDLPFSVTMGSSILAMLAPTTDQDSDDEDLATELFSTEGHVARPSINPLHIYFLRQILANSAILPSGFAGSTGSLTLLTTNRFSVRLFMLLAALRSEVQYSGSTRND